MICVCMVCISIYRLICYLYYLCLFNHVLFVISTIYVCLIMCCFASFVHCYVFLKISSRLNSSNEPMLYAVFVYTCIYASDF